MTSTINHRLLLPGELHKQPRLTWNFHTYAKQHDSCIICPNFGSIGNIGSSCE
jgi:hypothetical protein